MIFYAYIYIRVVFFIFIYFYYLLCVVLFLLRHVPVGIQVKPLEA